MGRLIDADALIKKAVVVNTDEECYSYILLEDVMDAPTIEERKVGEWLTTKSKDWYICSECGLCVRSCLPVHHLHYCHNCGAKMKCMLDCSCCSKEDCKERRTIWR